MKDKWAKNEKILKEALENMTTLDDITYDEYVKLVFDKIYNSDIPEDDEFERLDLDSITSIDNGGYQGTILYLIPFNIYQPAEWEYLMTYVGYGSCAVCDTLQGIQSCDGQEKLDGFLELGKDIICNTIKPYNEGWRHKDWFDTVEECEKYVQNFESEVKKNEK